MLRAACAYARLSQPEVETLQGSFLRGTFPLVKGRKHHLAPERQVVLCVLCRLLRGGVSMLESLGESCKGNFYTAGLEGAMEKGHQQEGVGVVE